MLLSQPGTNLSTVSAYFCIASCWVILPKSFHAVLQVQRVGIVPYF